MNEIPSDNPPTLPPIWGLVRDRQYLAYLLTRLFYTFAIQIITLAIGWSLYARTGNPIYLGLAGLILFAPQLVLVVFIGSAVDRFRRQDVLLLAILVIALAAFGLALSEQTGNDGVRLILALLVGVGIARAFVGPALRALLNNVVPRNQLPQAVAMNSSLTKISVVLGHVTGGVLFAISPTLAYALSCAILLVAAALTRMIRQTNQSTSKPKLTRADLLAGFNCIRGDTMLLGAMSLDLFAVFLGGVTALLPVYAVDVLGTTPVGLGILRSAPAVGAILVAGTLA